MIDERFNEDDKETAPTLAGTMTSWKVFNMIRLSEFSKMFTKTTG